MRIKRRSKSVSNVTEYEKGYSDGMKAAFEDSELDAYYTGVGYGKRQSKDKHIGFNSSEERRQFEKGVQNKDAHFKSYEVKEPSFFEKLFGKSSGSLRIVDNSTKKRPKRAKKPKKPKSPRSKKTKSKKRIKKS